MKRRRKPRPHPRLKRNHVQGKWNVLYETKAIVDEKMCSVRQRAQYGFFVAFNIYYIKLQCPFACLSVPPPPFSTRPSDRNQIWHTYSDRYGTGSHLKKLTHPHPRGNITSSVTSSNVEHVRHLKTTARRSMTSQAA